jgi:hypothetical protein
VRSWWEASTEADMLYLLYLLYFLYLLQASTEEEALNLLFLGDTNRTTSETPMNLAVSHIHIIYLYIHNIGNNTYN